MTAQSWREDAVGVRVAQLWGFSWEIQCASAGRVVSFSWRVCRGICGPFLSILPLASALAWRDSVFLEEGFWGVFRRWSIGFMVSGFCPEQGV